MSQADLEINRDVRKVMVRHWIDLGKLASRSANGRLFVRGSLQRIAGVREELTASIVEIIFTDLKKIRGVTNINTELENWSQVGGKWRAIDRDKDKATRARQETDVQSISDNG